MARPESGSRPTYVYLLALTALMLFGVNFTSYLSANCHDHDGHERTIVVHGPALDGIPDVVAVAPPAPDVTVELERARAEMHRVRAEMRRAAKQVQSMRQRSSSSFVYVP